MLYELAITRFVQCRHDETIRPSHPLPPSRHPAWPKIQPFKFFETRGEPQFDNAIYYGDLVKQGEKQREILFFPLREEVNIYCFFDPREPNLFQKNSWRSRYNNSN
jgi:hypothetical protein